jgi:endonuclease YncB( thermonuclease family)
MWRRICVGVLGALWAGIALAQSGVLAGLVERVTDGDSVWLAPASGPRVEVRLLGIDAPEGCQAWGPESRRALEALALGREARVDTKGRDTHGRTLGTLFVDGVNLNQRQVEEGHAWSMRFKWDQGPYVKQERMAKALNRGLFASGGAVMPRDFRRDHGPCQAGERPSSTPPRAASPAAPPGPGTSPLPPVSIPPSTLPSPSSTSAWRCDGRTRCSQMRSCEEATFFLKNCPGVQMDGDGNGVPCESQFCRRP